MRRAYLVLTLVAFVFLPPLSYAATPKPDFFDTAMKSQAGMDALTEAQKTELRAYLSAAALDAPGAVVSVDTLGVSLDKPTYAKGDPIVITASIVSSMLKGYADTHQGGTQETPKLSVKIDLTNADGSACIAPLDTAFPVANLSPTFTIPAENTCDHPKATVSLSDWKGVDLGKWEIRTPRIVPFVEKEKPATHEVSQDTAPTTPATTDQAPIPDQGSVTVKAGIIIVIAILFLASLGLIVWKTSGKGGRRQGRGMGIFLVLGTLAASMIVQSVSVQAQSSAEADASSVAGTILADINLSNVAILSQEKNVIKIGLDIENRSVVSQPDIRYGIELVSTTNKGQEKVDTFVADEAIAIAGKQSLHRDITYTAPTALSGTYDLWVIAKTTGGLVLGLASPGKVTFSAFGDRIAIDSASCYLSVGGGKYTLSQGVDIAKDEDLILTCPAENASGKALSVIPFFDTFRRTVYGPSVKLDYPTKTAIAFAKGEKKDISFPLPKAPAPQAYDVTVFLVNQSNNIPVSKTITAHYVLRGVSATIQNVSLDRATYQAGDSANVNLSWTPAADSFVGSRGGAGTAVTDVTATLSIVGSNGATCAAPFSKVVSPSEIETILSTQTTLACDGAVATVKLTDANGDTLDSRAVPGVDQPATPIGDVSTTTPPKQVSSGLKVALFIVVGILFCVGITLILGRIVLNRKHRVGGMKLFLLPLIVFGSFLSVHEVKAVTWSSNAVNTSPYNLFPAGYLVYLVNTDKTAYVTGEVVTFNSTMTVNTCNNHSTSGSITVQPPTGGLVTIQSSYFNAGTVAGSASISAPSTPGKYTVTLNGCNYVDAGSMYTAPYNTAYAPYNGTYCTASSISFSVAPPISDAEAQCYLNRYTDLVAAYGATNITAAKAHWISFGYFEGRDKSCPLPPPAPTGLSLSCNNGTMTASWNATPGVSNYLLRMNDSGNNTVIYEDNWTSTSISRYVGYGTYWYWMHAGTTSNYSAATSGSVTCATPVAGTCGSVNGTTAPSLSSGSAGLCTAGTVASFSGSGPWSWSCTGSGGGSTASCSASKTATVVNGSCGSANGTTVASAPASGLCNSGTASGVSGSGPWSWTCAGSGGGSTASCSASLYVAPPAPDFTLTASPTSVVSGNASTITWLSVINATSCTASNGWSGSKSTAGGSTSTGALSSDTTYTLSCTGAGGKITHSVTVTVTKTPPPVPTIDFFYASPTSITSGNSSYLYWSSSNTTSCTATNGWSGIQGVSGFAPVTPTKTTTYTLTCTGPGGTTAPRDAIVTVKTNGFCGPAAGTTVPTKPSVVTDLCSVGTPSVVSTSTTYRKPDWSWSCDSTGSSALCSANCTFDCKASQHCDVEESWRVKNDCGKMVDCSGGTRTGCDLNFTEVQPNL